MRAKLYNLITVLLVLALVAGMAISAGAAKTSGTQDGLYVVLNTDKAEYTADELISVSTQIINN